MGTFEIEISMEQMVQLLRVTRHDWLNHIQVLDGLLKLENVEGVKQYLQQITCQLQQEQFLFDLGVPAFTIYLFTYRVKFPMIQFEMECTERLRLNQYSGYEQHIQLLIQLLDELGCTSQQNNDRVSSLLLRMGKLDDKIVFECDFLGNYKTCISSEWWYSLKSQWLNIGAMIHEKVTMDDEWVIEIIMG